MPSLASLIPARFARACATEGFVPACRTALAQLADAPNATAAASILGGVAAGPAAFLVLYAGGALVEWHIDQKRERKAKARARRIDESLARIEGLIRAGAEVAQIDCELDETLKSDKGAHVRFAEESVGESADADAAIARHASSALEELGIPRKIDDILSEFRMYGPMIVEIRDTTRKIDRKQDTALAKHDAQLTNQDEMLRLLREIDQRQKSAGPQAPELSDEDKRVLAEARAHGDAKAKARAAIMQRDFAAADPLIEAVTQRAAAELFDALTLKGDRHYYAGEFDAAVEPYEKALELLPNDLAARKNAAIARTFARLGDLTAHRRRAIEIHLGTLELVDEGSPDWAMTQGNLGAAYWALPTGDRPENLANAISAYESALTVYTRAAHSAGWTATQNNLGNTYRKLQTGDRAVNLANAISAYESALTVFTRESHPAEWAATQNNLGAAYAQLPTGDKAENLSKAIKAHESALQVRTREAHPADWATTQNNLGVAYEQLPTGDKAENLFKAIKAYELAQTVRTREAHPAEWAGTQYNLGNVYRNLPTGDRAENLAAAIEAYESALTVHTREAHPADWARTQNNLGISYAELPTGDRAENLANAIAAFKSALTVYTREAHPADWAQTQNNLGNAYADLPTGDKAENLAKAISAYESALTVYTREAHPAEWATAQNNLGIAYADLPTGDRAENLVKAISAYESALTVRTREAHPAEWAMTQNNLGNAYAELPTGDKAENLATAILAFEVALTVLTREAHPAGWALTQNNLGAALAMLSDQSGQDRCGLLRRAIACSTGALTVRTAEAFPREHTDTLHNLAIMRDRYESAGCSPAFDEIEPAR